MLKTTILAAGAAILLAGGAQAQQQPSTQQQPSVQPQTQQPPSAAPTIRTISVVDMEQLPEATQAQVNAVVAKRSEADLRKLRNSIDATPQVKSALEAQGMTSAQVVAASLAQDGTLTLITKKKAS